MELLPGRLHPLIVHLPIGFLLMAFLLELLSLSRRWKKVRRAVVPVLYSGIIAGIAAVGSGYLLAQEGGQEEDLLFRHQLFAILSLVVAVMLAVLIGLGKAFSGRSVRMLLFVFMITGVAIAGHFGGMMTHGRDYLSVSSAADDSQQQMVKRKPSDPGKLLMYDDLVRPVLEEKCYSCHNQTKQKGKLRLDSEEFIRRGGKHGSVLDGQSELLVRISRSVEEEGHMPPREKEQLTGMEIGILSAWLKSGASFTVPADSIPSELVKDAIRMMAQVYVDETSWLPDPAGREVLSEQQLRDLRISGMRITPVAAGSPWLEVTASGPDNWGNPHWKIWDKIADRVVSARFSFTGISDAQLAIVAKAPELRRLMCDHTAISDVGLRNLKNAGSLERLNIGSTRTTASGLNDLGSLPALRELFASGCGLDSLTIRGFQKKFPRIRIVAGDPRLPFIPADTTEFR